MQLPSGPPFFSELTAGPLPGLVSCVLLLRRREPPEPSARSVAANALGLGPRDRRCNSCRADQFRNAAVAEIDEAFVF